MRRLLISLMWAMLLVGSEASAFTDPPFPRVGAMWIGNKDYQDSEVQQALARGNVAVISAYPGWGSTSGTNLQQAIQKMKAINPNLLVFQYLNDNEISSDRGSNAALSAIYSKLDSMHWWLYQNGGSGNIVNSWFPGAYETNNTLLVPTDSNGDTYVSWYAKWAVQTYASPAPALDGFYLDDVFWEPRVDGDYNRDGTTDSASNPTTATWWRQGLRKHFDTMHQQMPGKFQIGNVDWGASNAVYPELNQVLNGGFMEGMVGFSWSFETWSGWTAMMQQYRKIMGALASPQMGLFAQLGNANDYQGFRYGLTSCLMDNGYFVYNTTESYSDAPGFDEYNAKLGNATSGPQTSAWQQGVYRRDFENGIALVNPKGNGARTVTLETSYKKLSGSQAPGVNNGQTVTSVTLQDRDGIILMRLTQTVKPNPPTNVTVK